ncbi:MAG: hypothetical protein ACI4F3_07220, partial [Enterocloster sp.]
MSMKNLRSRKRESRASRLARFLHREGKKCCAVALCASLIVGNMGNMAAAANEGTDNEYEFELSSEALYEALQEAIAEDSIADNRFEFAGEAAETYDSLMNEGILYELKPDMEDNDGDVKLSVFARLDGEVELFNAPEFSDSEEMIFLLTNTSEKEKTAVIYVDGRATEEIKVAPKSAVLSSEGPAAGISAGPAANIDNTAASGGTVIINGGTGVGGGSSSGGKGDSGSESSVVIVDETGDGVNGENGVTDAGLADGEAETGEIAGTDEKTGEISGSDQENSAAQGGTDNTGDSVVEVEDPERSEEAEKGDAGNADSDAGNAGSDIGDTDGKDDGNSEGTGSDDTDQGGKSGNDGDTSGNDDTSDTGVSGGDDSDNGDTNDSASDDNTSDGDTSDGDAAGDSLAPVISRHRICLVTATATSSEAEKEETEQEEAEEGKTDTATLSEAEKADVGDSDTEDTEATSSEASKDMIEGTVYETVLMDDRAAAAFVTTTEELGVNKSLDEFAADSKAIQVYNAESDDVMVEVRALKGTFPEDAEMEVVKLIDGDKQYETARKALESEDTDFDGMMAFDISFYDSNGYEIEPEDKRNVW